VPHMGLQPIVENAIRHGIGRRTTSGLIRIRASRVADSLHVEVQDDGPGFATPGAGGLGLGLANTRARLRQLYGEAGELRAGNVPRVNPGSGGAVVTLVLPYHLAEVG